MTRCSDVQRDAAALMALAADDPERAEALRHAAGCPACRRALAEGARLVTLLDEEPAPPPPRPELLAQVARELSPRRRVGLAWPAGALLGGWGVLASIKHSDLGELPESLAVLAVALAALLAARLRVVPLAGTLALSMLLALPGGWRGELAPGVGVLCIATELGAALFPVAAALWCARRARAALDALELAVIAGAGALAGQAVLTMACPNGFVGHGLLFHAGGVALAVLGGAALGRRLTAAAPGSAA